jgi:hypothetical protein
MPDPMPALVASVLGVVGAITAAGLTVASARLGTRGRRRGWRPARIQRNV